MTVGGPPGAVEGNPWDIDRRRPHAARIYDFYLGGENHFEVDRQAALHAAEVHPGGLEEVRRSVRSNRAFLGRAVTWLAGEAGIRQFLDIGSGIPNGDNVHAVAQRVDPEARIVYVDNDPIVMAYAHELRRRSKGTVDYLNCDLRDTDKTLVGASVTLDFSEPVAVLLIGILHFFPESDHPYEIVERLMGAVCPGSYLTVCHLAADIHPDEMAEAVRRFNRAGSNETWVLRSREEVGWFFSGLELVEPGVVQIDQWRPDDAPAPVVVEGRANPLLVGVGKKP